MQNWRSLWALFMYQISVNPQSQWILGKKQPSEFKLGMCSKNDCSFIPWLRISMKKITVGFASKGNTWPKLTLPGVLLPSLPKHYTRGIDTSLTLSWLIFVCKKGEFINVVKILLKNTSQSTSAKPVLVAIIPLFVSGPSHLLIVGLSLSKK